MAFTDEEKNILQRYVTSTEDNVFAIKGIEGLVGAVYARYSRAKGGFREVLLKEFIEEGQIDPKHADELIARVLVAYGDDSVGELEGTHVSFEKISMLATKEIEDHRIGGSPIEQSTRYVLYDQKDEAGNWLYYRDEAIANSAFGKQYAETMDFIFQTYADLVEPMKDYFVNLKSIDEAEYDINGDGTKEKWADVQSDEKLAKAFKQTYNFDLRAKACDTLRALLPLSTFTNVGIFGNGRFFQTVISHLLSQDLPEFKTLGDKTYKACSDVIPQYVRRAKRNDYDVATRTRMFEFAKKFSAATPGKPAALPSYVLEDRGEKFIAEKLKGQEITPEKLSQYLQLASDIRQAANILYPYTNVSMDTLRQSLANDEDHIAEVVRAYVGERQTRRDRPGRGIESGYEYNFDLVTNWGVYKDLMRHRMNSQQRQLFTTKIGFDMPQELVAAGFEDKVRECVAKADALYDAMAAVDPVMAQYAVLHGHFVRWSISFNDREATHMLELRSTPQGHPNYRYAAQQMHKLIAERSKWRGDMMKFVDYNDYYWSRADSEAKQRVKEAELDKKYGKE